LFIGAARFATATIPSSGTARDFPSDRTSRRIFPALRRRGSSATEDTPAVSPGHNCIRSDVRSAHDAPLRGCGTMRRALFTHGGRRNGAWTRDDAPSRRAERFVRKWGALASMTLPETGPWGPFALNDGSPTLPADPLPFGFIASR